MLNLTLLSDSEIISKTKAYIAAERAALSEVLRHLREVDSRRLFAARGFSSLFEFVIKDLGYSEGAASRRNEVVV